MPRKKKVEEQKPHLTEEQVEAMTTEEEKEVEEQEELTPEEDARRASRSFLASVATQFQTIQRVRVAVGLSIKSRERYGHRVDPRMVNLHGMMLDVEGSVVEYMRDEVEKQPEIYAWLTSIQGIGLRTAAMLIGLIDIRRSASVSALWKFSGLGVTNGHADKRESGVKLCYSMRLKKTMYLVARGLIMSGNKLYVGIYRESKEKYAREHPEWLRNEKGKEIKGGKLHVDLAARRRMLKIFAQHLWITWREIEGLPVSKPWVHEHGGHVDLIPPPPRP